MEYEFCALQQPCGRKTNMQSSLPLLWASEESSNAPVWGTCRFREGSLRSLRNQQIKSASLSLDALRPDLSPMRLDNMPGNR